MVNIKTILKCDYIVHTTTHKSQTNIYSPFSFIKIGPKKDLNTFSVYSGSHKRKSLSSNLDWPNDPIAGNSEIGIFPKIVMLF